MGYTEVGGLQGREGLTGYINREKVGRDEDLKEVISHIRD